MFLPQTFPLSSGNAQSTKTQKAYIIGKRSSLRAKVLWLTLQSIVVPLVAAFFAALFLAVRVLLITVLPNATSKPEWSPCYKDDNPSCWQHQRSVGGLIHEILSWVVCTHIALFIFIRLTLPHEVNSGNGRRRMYLSIIIITITAVGRIGYFIYDRVSVKQRSSGVNTLAFLLQFIALLYHRHPMTFIRRLLTIPVPFTAMLLFPNVIFTLASSHVAGTSGRKSDVLSVLAIAIPFLYSGLSWLLQASIYKLLTSQTGRGMDESALLGAIQFGFQMMQILLSISYARRPFVVMALATTSTLLGFIISFVYRRHSRTIWGRVSSGRVYTLSDRQVTPREEAGASSTINSRALPAAPPLPSGAVMPLSTCYKPGKAEVQCCTPVANSQALVEPKIVGFGAARLGAPNVEDVARREETGPQKKGPTGEEQVEPHYISSLSYHWLHRKALVLVICILFGIGSTAVIASACRYYKINLVHTSCTDGEGVFKLDLTFYPYLVVLCVVWGFALVVEVLSQGEMFAYWTQHWRSVFKVMFIQYVTWGPFFTSYLHWIMVETEWSVCEIKQDQ